MYPFELAARVLVTDKMEVRGRLFPEIASESLEIRVPQAVVVEGLPSCL
jgi:hypothetical protein